MRKSIGVIAGDWGFHIQVLKALSFLKPTASALASHGCIFAPNGPCYVYLDCHSCPFVIATLEAG